MAPFWNSGYHKVPTAAWSINFQYYVSQYVKFVESVFPFTYLSKQSLYHPSNIIATLIPPPLWVSSSSLILPLNPPSAVQIPQRSLNKGESSIMANTSSPLNSQEPANSISSQQPTPNTNPTESHAQPTHSMTTRAKNNIHKPLTKMNLNAQLFRGEDLKPTQ